MYFFRELAFQIAEQFNVLGKPINVRVTVITGGLGNILLNPKIHNSFNTLFFYSVES